MRAHIENAVSKPNNLAEEREEENAKIF